jgi:hypothetical protein
MTPENLKKLRLVINESSRVQRGGADPVPYIDVSNVLTDVVARQNHAVFGRRGCGKTLLLRRSADTLPTEVRSVCLNCDDFKKHSFPNVLIEILDALFGELGKQLPGWFGKKKRSRELVGKIRRELQELREKADRRETDIREAETAESRNSEKTQIALGSGPLSLSASSGQAERQRQNKRKKRTRSSGRLSLRILSPTPRQEFESNTGGSVKPENAAELLRQEDIDGALVGELAWILEPLHRSFAVLQPHRFTAPTK